MCHAQRAHAFEPTEDFHYDGVDVTHAQHLYPVLASIRNLESHPSRTIKRLIKEREPIEGPNGIAHFGIHSGPQRAKELLKSWEHYSLVDNAPPPTPETDLHDYLKCQSSSSSSDPHPSRSFQPSS